MIGYLNKAVLTSCFAGGVTAALSRIYLIHRDEKEDQCSTTQTVKQFERYFDSRISALEKLKETDAEKHYDLTE
ncbi:unnamed protein product [Cuscuta campestris]|uniref:Uncharacterized protein n=1 Tax=Cuscuta campestris TaxID=132261 RepID=A0A484L8B1_9ASTE|nr:unnamed protein product [Cuscuta campestris]